MNIALSTILIILLILPGLIFRRSFYTKEFSSNYFAQSVFMMIAGAIIPSIVIHVVFVHFFTDAKYWFSIFPFKTFFIPLKELLFNSITLNQKSVVVWDNFYSNSFDLGVFLVGIWLTSAITGSLFQFIIRRWHLDWYIKAFRYPNHWYYKFSREYFFLSKKFKKLIRNKKIKLEDILAMVSCMVRIEEGTILYRGVLEDYKLSKTGVDYIILSDPKRVRIGHEDKLRKNDFTSDNDRDLDDNDIHFIQDDFLIIPFEKIENITIEFRVLSEDEDSD